MTVVLGSSDEVNSKVFEENTDVEKAKIFGENSVSNDH